MSPDTHCARSFPRSGLDLHARLVAVGGHEQVGRAARGVAHAAKDRVLEIVALVRLAPVVGIRIRQVDETVRVGDGQRPEQKRVQQRERARVRAQRQREREDGGQRESRRAAQDAPREPRVLDQGVQPGQEMRLGAGFPVAQRAAEAPVGPPRIQALGGVLRAARLQVETHLLVDLFVQWAAAEDIREPM